MDCISTVGGAHIMFDFTKKEKNSHTIISNVTRAVDLPFSNYSSISSPSQLPIPPETMSSGTVYAADLCITAQRLLETAKVHGKWEKTHNPCPSWSQKDLGSSSHGPDP
jgi:hypothetical protein